jgi:hypothetical protein
MLTAACEGAPPTNEATATDTVDAAPKAAPVTLKEASPAVKWELKIEGMPVLNGPTLINFDLGDTTKYSMMSAEAMSTIDLNKGAWDPETFNTVFSSSNVSCLYSAQNKYKSSGMTVKLTATGGEFSGEVTCLETGNADAEQVNHKVTGWFIL